MKKLLLLFTILLNLLPAHADEGMWTLYNLPQAAYEQMKAEGFEMPYEDLYLSDNAIKNCVVNFSGYCSGVVVSKDGLVFTNHHCGFEAIRSHSTVDHDYMLNGFYAKSQADELPNKGMFVSFMVDQQDITDQIMAAGFEYMSNERREMLLDSIENKMYEEVRAKDSTLTLEIKPFYEGNKYYATTYRKFNDLRLVFAIPKSMGKFGGDTDNWMWPRQTCDFSVFRIYANPKTNGPADYSEDNVPYQPESWAPVAMDGYKDGDFSMTIGYPGSTERYLSSFGIREMRNAENTTRVQVRGLKQEIMKRHMDASEAVRIKYDSKYAQSANYWKNSMGMNKCIDSIGIIQLKQAHEQRIRHYQDSTGYLKDKLDLDLLEKLYSKRYHNMEAFYYYYETFRRTSEIVTRALRANAGSVELHGDPKKPRKQYFVFKDNSDEWDEALDKEVLAALMQNYKERVDQDYHPDFFKTVEKNFGGDFKSYVDYLYKESILMKSGKKIYPAKKEYLNDPAVQMGLDLMSIISELGSDVSAVSDSIDEQERYLCAAKIRMEQDMPHYSDANFTMRLSYGQVGEYLLNGQPSGYYTTAESMVEKMRMGDRIEDYKAEPIMHELLSSNDFGKYLDKETGKMQLCFLTNNDITGGNSGSPMFNGKGELIGLAFDGNWDSLSSDIFFDSRLARCIGVDIRYVLFMMDRWGHADRLIEEIFRK